MEWILIGLVLLPFLGALLAIKGGNDRPEFARQVAVWVTMGTLLLAATVLAVVHPRPGASGVIHPQLSFRTSWIDITAPFAGRTLSGPIEIYLAVDGNSMWLVMLTTIVSLAAVLVSLPSIGRRVGEYFGYLMALEGCLLGVFLSMDIVLFYLFFEATLLPLYLLVGIWGGRDRWAAATQFFLYTLVGSLLSLTGLIVLVLSASQLAGDRLVFSIPDLAEIVQVELALHELAADQTDAGTSGPANAGSADVVAGPAGGRGSTLPFINTTWWVFLAFALSFAIKVPLIPLHSWQAPLYQESPIPITAITAAVVAKLGTFGFLRIALPLLPTASFELGQPLLATLATIGIVYGALAALAQTDLRRMLAYSSISHLGFSVLGLFSLTAEGIQGGVFQMVNHGLTAGGLFLVLAILLDRFGSVDLRELGGVASRMPMLAALAVLLAMASAGLPGLNGFVSEFLCLAGAFRICPWMAAGAALGVVLGAWYLLRFIQLVFFGAMKNPANSIPADLEFREYLALLPIAGLCILLGVVPNVMLHTIGPEVDSLVDQLELAQRVLGAIRS